METKKLILIIDDEPDFVETMKFFLENSNFRVVSAFTAEDGLEKAGLHKPDLILLDLIMPKISGHEVCRRIKENNSTAHIPIIILTAKDKILDKVEAFNLGATDYIGKHFSFEEILARIKAALREGSPETDSRAKEERDKKILALRKVIDEKSIRMLFQPIVVLATRQPTGYEALMRGPQASFLENPLELLALATEANMLLELHILSLSLAAKMASFIPPGLLLFLNTDPLIINTDYFRNMDFLKNSTMKPSQICIEITERTYIKSFTKLSSDLEYLKSRGVKIGVDDVGEGYASLKAIAELKPEFLKVDIDIVRNIDSDKIKNSLMRLILELAKEINSHLVAEGIETEAENNALIAMGVEYGQGFLFAKPCAPPQAEMYAARNPPFYLSD